MLAAWHVDSGSLTQLGHEITEQVTPLKHRNLAYAAEWKEYAMERSIGRPSADIYLVDLANGQRTKIKEKLTEDRYLRSEPRRPLPAVSRTRSILGYRRHNAQGRQHHQEHQDLFHQSRIRRDRPAEAAVRRRRMDQERRRSDSLRQVRSLESLARRRARHYA